MADLTPAPCPRCGSTLGACPPDHRVRIQPNPPPLPEPGTAAWAELTGRYDDLFPRHAPPGWQPGDDLGPGPWFKRREDGIETLWIAGEHTMFVGYPSGRDWLPTMPGTMFEFSTARPWCAGHRWAGRARWLGWLHRWAHRARILRVKAAPPPPRGYVDELPRRAPLPRSVDPWGHPWCYCYDVPAQPGLPHAHMPTGAIVWRNP